MNKKFITLLASGLMLASFGASAQDIIGTETVPEPRAASDFSSKVYYIVTDNNGILDEANTRVLGANTDASKNITYDVAMITDVLGSPTTFNITKKAVLGTTFVVDNYYWQVTQVVVNGNIRYQLKNVKTGDYLAINQNTGYIEKDASVINPATHNMNFKSTKASGLWDNGALGIGEKFLHIYDEKFYLFSSGTTKLFLVEVPAKTVTDTDLNKLLGSGFALDFKKAADLKESLTVEANPFSNATIKAIPVDGNDKEFYFRTSGEYGDKGDYSDEKFRASKFIVMDTLKYSVMGFKEAYKYIEVSGSEMMTEDGKTTPATYEGLKRRIENAVFSATKDDVNGNGLLKIWNPKAMAPEANNGKGLAGHTVSLTDKPVTVYEFEKKYYIGSGD